jgi:hypothetical protein
MRSPTTASQRMRAFVTTNTQLRTSELYRVNPADAAICPTKSQRDTPSLVPSRHCFATCCTSVASRIAELVHPIASVTS